MKRYEELDSLRGIAAFSVLMCHLMSVLPQFGDYGPESFGDKLLIKTPLHLYWAGHEAVMLFFLLSGFVLALPYLNKKELPYQSFLLKRICRLYIPYFVAILIAVLMHHIFYAANGISEASNWYNKQWDSHFGWSLFLKHLLFVDQFDINAYDPPIWSLVHEMRISIIFPFLMLLVTKFNWKKVMLVSLIISYLAIKVSIKYQYPMIDYFVTIHYATIFIVGASIAKYRNRLIVLFKQFSISMKIVLGILSVCLITYTYFPVFPSLHNKYINEWLTVIGAAYVLISALSYPYFSKFLRLRPIAFMGKISFSFYLYHMIIVFIMINTFYGRMPIILLWGSILIISLVVSTFSYYLVEKPSMKLGRKLGNKANYNRKVFVKKVS